MNEDCLALTAYLGERERVPGGRFAADALLDLCEGHAVAASMLLRGALGFGAEHHLRTDRVLTLSEDLPLVITAVDTRERIEVLAGEAATVVRRGLVTLERARLLTGDLTAAPLRAAPGEAKLTIHVGRQERAAGAPAFVAVCELLHRRGLAGATALLGVDGTVHGVRRRAGFLARNADVPMAVVAVGAAERFAAVLPELGALLRRPLLTLEGVQVCKRDGVLLARPRLPDVAARDAGAPRVKLTVYASEQARHDRLPLHVALVRGLREAGASGATAVRGIWGFHGDHAPHGDRLLRVRRRVPVVTTVVDAPERIAAAFAVVDEMTANAGLVTSEIVPALVSARGR